ncbi:MAG: tetratricopeptide repeat protein, partial [Pseudomonadota bacterium]|nr:tetratricopeptide repeat protein [Pseudomonadota bacterium]
VQMVDKLINFQPDNPYFFELKGQILYESGHLDKSIAPYRKSVAIAPEEPLLQIGLATSLISLETKASAKEALEILKKALRMEKDNITAYYQMATAYALLGDTGRAELATAERYYILGRLKIASMHAYRAMKHLPKNSPEWLKAQDIMANL